jgi:hypothetical protein
MFSKNVRTLLKRHTHIFNVSITTVQGVKNVRLRYSMYNNHISYVHVANDGISVNMVSFWKAYDMKIIHHIKNFQNFCLYLIYIFFNFTLMSIGRAHLIKIFIFKEIMFSFNSRGRKLYTFLLLKYQIKWIIYLIYFRMSDIVIFAKGR